MTSRTIRVFVPPPCRICGQPDVPGHRHCWECDLQLVDGVYHQHCGYCKVLFTDKKEAGKHDHCPVCHEVVRSQQKLRSHLELCIVKSGVAISPRFVYGRLVLLMCKTCHHVSERRMDITPAGSPYVVGRGALHCQLCKTRMALRRRVGPVLRVDMEEGLALEEGVRAGYLQQRVVLREENVSWSALLASDGKVLVETPGGLEFCAIPQEMDVASCSSEDVERAGEILEAKQLERVMLARKRLKG